MNELVMKSRQNVFQLNNHFICTFALDFGDMNANPMHELLIGFRGVDFSMLRCGFNGVAQEKVCLRFFVRSFVFTRNPFGYQKLSK